MQGSPGRQCRLVAEGRRAAAPASALWWLPALLPPAAGCAMARLRLLTLR